MRAGVIRYTYGARTSWHCHAGDQTRYVTEGRGLPRAPGGVIVKIRHVDLICTQAGECRWHGAAPNTVMSQIAILEVDEHANSASWGEHVSDDKYHGQTQAAREEEA
jgi:quercetin dioxygenase-like cupin family protein